jgi:hypothetical protein
VAVCPDDIGHCHAHFPRDIRNLVDFGPGLKIRVSVESVDAAMFPFASTFAYPGFFGRHITEI